MSLAAAATAASATKPLMRGWSHLVAFVASLGGTAALLAHAPSGAPRTLTLVYGACLSGLFGISALYHCPYWSVGARKILRRFDHSAIFLLIAGTFTPFSLALEPSQARALLIVGWIAAALGVLRAQLWTGAPKRLVAAQGVLTGWSVVFFLPALYRELGPAPLSVVALGGLLYTVGAAVFAYRRPNPWPKVFGFHEIFHLFVVAAAACHYGVVAWLVGRA